MRVCAAQGHDRCKRAWARESRENTSSAGVASAFVVCTHSQGMEAMKGTTFPRMVACESETGGGEHHGIRRPSMHATSHTRAAASTWLPLIAASDCFTSSDNDSPVIAPKDKQIT